jgi:hypothetical protein
MAATRSRSESAAQRTVYRPGELLQFDLGSRGWRSPVGHGQTRRGFVVTCELGFSRATSGALVFSKQAPDLLWGMARCLRRLGALPATVVWDREGAIAPRGEASEPFLGFCGQLALGWPILEAADPESKGLLERHHRYLRLRQITLDITHLGRPAQHRYPCRLVEILNIRLRERGKPA